MYDYSIWIEAEQWDNGWNPADDNSDVIVTFSDGAKWAATFFTYLNIRSLTEKNKVTGENLRGKYFWSSNMILVDELTRSRIKQVIDNLICENRFKTVFTRM